MTILFQAILENAELQRLVMSACESGSLQLLRCSRQCKDAGASVAGLRKRGRMKLKECKANFFVYSVAGDCVDPQGFFEDTKCLERYDIERNLWETMSPLPHQGQVAAIAHLQKHIYVMGLCQRMRFTDQSGIGFRDSFLNWFGRYDVEKDVWEELGLLPPLLGGDRMLAPEAAVALQGSIYVASQFYILKYTPRSGEWLVLRDCRNLARSFTWGSAFKMLSLGGCLYIVYVQPGQPCERFEPHTGRFEQLPPLPCQRSRAAACRDGKVRAVGTRIVILTTGPEDWNPGGLGSCWSFDTQGGRGWVEGPQATIPRRLAEVAALQGSLYVLKGMYSEDVDEEEFEVTDAERLTFRGGQSVWERVPGTNFGGGGGIAVVEDLCSMISIGGVDGEDEDAPPHSAVELLRVFPHRRDQHGIWQRGTPVPTPRRLAKLVVVRFPCDVEASARLDM
ncbi:unnamed protein product [Polarella glacialis]|uniref:F-box/kelch-repeat protein n=1 Tax=Polarella glacialis TaxID=89957 RepID=A0A813EXN8_POLGL|nr:unnamed protein product [Polarella glacialis]CAE8718492.1 unnamed protein product [Polarella glacialis]